jgi:phage head maturation protease
LEFAGGTSIGNVIPTREGVIARAPQWWRNLANQGLRAAAAAVEASPVVRSPATLKVSGWLAGAVAPGVSLPAFNHSDKLTVREQFTGACWARVLEQFRKAGSPITLRWGHEGGTLATTEDLSLMLDIHPVVGLTFDGRLRDDALSKTVLEAAGKGGLACSIAYRRGKTWVVERDGVTIRVVDSAEVDHIAVLPPSQTPAYPAARCFARRGVESACPEELKRDARVHAWRALKAEQGL